MTSESMRRGLAAAHARNASLAVTYFAQALEQSPDDPIAVAWLGQSLCAIGQRLDGAARLREAGELLLAQSKIDSTKLIEIIVQLQQWGDVVGGVELCERTLVFDRRNARLHHLFAVGLSQLGRTLEALGACQVALELDPNNPMLKVLLGSLQADSGQLEEARRTLAGILLTPSAPLVAFRANKELARVFDHQGKYEEAFVRLEAAGAASRSVPEFAHLNLQTIPLLIRENWNGFDGELLGRWSTTSFDETRSAPTFVVGFFRSGTTLTQEVLATHPLAFVADEAGLIYEVQQELKRIDPSNATTSDKLRRLSKAQIAGLRSHYWTQARGRFGDDCDRKEFVDKLTMNIVDVALINVIFPDAKLVVMLRDPRDVCISCFMQLMPPTDSTAYLLEWSNTADLYSATMSWWIHIRDQLTMAKMEVKYEDAITDFETTYRKVTAFVGLDWDPGLVDFHKQAVGKFISTPSRNQVSKPIYASSMGRWRRYKEKFQAVADRLDYFITAFDYPPN